MSIDERYAKTGRAPIIARCVDISKGDHTTHNYRSRLVARETSTHKRDDPFVGIPPVETCKGALSMTASGDTGEVIMRNDVGRAFFHARGRREVHVQFADENKQPGDERTCCRLNCSMYGSRDVAQNGVNENA